jgi:hypothetical protein
VPSDERQDLRVLLNPIVLLALIIVLSIIALIGAAVLGIDRGVLSSMAKPEYARGLVTYLFAVVTIGTAVVLVLSALLGTEDEIHERRFQRGKEILSLLLGVFGVIVGYYFGAEKATLAAQPMRVSFVDVTPNPAHAGDKLTIRALAVGGVPPYLFAVGQDDDKLDPRKSVPEGGLIITDIVVRQSKSPGSGVIHLQVRDAAGQESEALFPIKFDSQ